MQCGRLRCRGHCPRRAQGGQPRDSARRRADAQCRGGGARREGLRALGRNEPGCHRHRARAAGARCACADRSGRRPPGNCARRAGAPSRDDGAGRPHVAAAGVAGHAGHQARRRAERARSSSAATGRSASPGAGRAVRRRCRDAGVARRSRHCRHRGARREPGLDVPDVAVAHAARPVLRCRGNARHADGDARQARARHLAARPVGSRRSAGTRAAGPRRIVDDAAETQSGRCGDRARGGGARARTRIDDVVGCRAGARAGARQLACRMGLRCRRSRSVRPAQWSRWWK